MGTPKTPAEVSPIRKTARLPNGMTAVIRPPNFEELRKFLADEPKDSYEAAVALFDVVRVDGPLDLDKAPRFSFGRAAIKLAGQGKEAKTVAPEELTDEKAAEAFAGLGDPENYICMAFDGAEFVLRRPLPSQVDGFIKGKMKGSQLDANKDLLFKLRFYGDLDALCRDKPCGVAALTDELVTQLGFSMEAELGEA